MAKTDIKTKSARSLMQAPLYSLSSLFEYPAKSETNRRHAQHSDALNRT
jgi:hypothetical protein